MGLPVGTDDCLGLTGDASPLGRGFECCSHLSAAAKLLRLLEVVPLPDRSSCCEYEGLVVYGDVDSSVGTGASAAATAPAP